MKRLLFFTLFTLAVLVPTFPQNFPEISEIERLRKLEPPGGRVAMVLDTDTFNEVDDQFALVYALTSPEEVDLQAVYAAPFLNSRSESPGDGMERSYREILRIQEMMGTNVPALRGSEDFLEDKGQPLQSAAAADLIERARNRSPEDPLYVVAVGAITNVASAFLLEPAIIPNVVVVWLGGQAHYMPSAREFNLSQDLLSSQVIFDSGVPLIQMCTRPVVSHLHTSLPELKHHLAGKNEVADYLYEIVVDYSQGREVYSKVIWDVVAVAWLIQPDWVPTVVVHSPILTDQHTYSRDPSRHFMKISTSLNRDAIFADLFRKIADVTP